MNIIAEISCNHCQKFDKAMELIRAAAWAGADTVKVQMYRPEQMADPNGFPFAVGEKWSSIAHNLYDLYTKTHMPYDWVPVLKQIAEKLDLKFATSVYHPDTVDIAEDMGIEYYKTASQEILYEDLFRRLAKTGKTVFVSTGGAEYTEVFAVTRWLTAIRKKVYLLHCVSEYPAPMNQMNLRTIYDLSRLCYGKVGLSDHSTGIVAPVVAATMGAQVIEKHLKLDNNCPDAEFSLNPEQFRNMVLAVKQAKEAEGNICYGGTKKYRRVNVNGIWLRR